jgi:hypothetical protein
MQNYDGDLQMVVEKTEPKGDVLAFLRWLADNHRLEHEVAGAPSGPYAEWVRAPQEVSHAAA